MELLFDTWRWARRDGWVFLSTKPKTGEWKDHAFQWPEDKAEIADFVARRTTADVDLYWSPLVFRSKRRAKDGVEGARVLFQDLDSVDPVGIVPRPTEAWESGTTGHYHGLWRLTEELSPADHERINKALAYSVGADKGGWDLTQVLRVPGTRNHKTSPSRPVRLLWEGESPVDAFAFERHRKGAASAGKEGASLAGLLSKHKGRIPQGTSARLQYPPSMATKGGRSEMLWRIESELIQAKVPLEDVIELVRLSAWNKYRGRADEAARIRSEVDKVYAEQQGLVEVGDGGADAEPGSNGGGPSPPQPRITAVSYADLMAAVESRPGWLVEKMWLRESHGIVAGEPKTFKSTLTLDLAMSVASGKPLWGVFPVHDLGPVVIIQNENADWIQQDRMAKIAASKGLGGKVGVVNGQVVGKWPTDLPIHSVNNAGFMIDDDEMRDAVEELLLAVKPKLVVFDPLYLMFGGDVNSAKELQAALRWLMSLRNEHKTAVMLIHHWNKNGESKRGGQRMLGSTTLHGWTESALYASQAPATDAGFGISVEREFRGGGLLPKLELAIREGEFGDPLYSVTVIEADDAARAELKRMVDDSAGGWLTVAAIVRDLGISRSRAEDLAHSDPTLEVFEGPRGARTIRRRSK
jgi:hypothetical protein